MSVVGIEAPGSSIQSRPDATRTRPVGSVWRAPLVPAALAFTAGIVIDRYGSIPLEFSIAAAAVSLIAWAAVTGAQGSWTVVRGSWPGYLADKRVRMIDRGLQGLPLIYLGVAAASFGCAYHHWHRDIYPADDIGAFATEESRPVLLHGVIHEEPTISWHKKDDPLQSFARPDSTRAVLRATHLKHQDDWIVISGLAQLQVGANPLDAHVGDEVEIEGWLEAPRPPGNPGEFDYASFLRDQRIRAIVHVKKTTRAVVRLTEGWQLSPSGRLAQLRGWGQRSLQASLPENQAGVAMALLLGEGSTMTNEDWDQYIRTGVIHVLAISGQHLVILGGFLWAVLRLLMVRRRTGAILVALILLGYALLVGARPPVLRSAVTVCACCIGIMLRRPALTANSFALAWIVVGLLNPTDIFGGGCQLSFLAVAILYWGVSRWFRSEPDPLQRLVHETRPRWQRTLRWLGRQVALSYGVTLVIWLAAAPLVGARYHTVSPVGILIGPPIVLLTSVALLAGFLLLLASAVCWPLVPLCAWFTDVSLAGCGFLVQAGERLPGAYWYVAGFPDWWMWVFYIGLVAFLILEPLQRRWRLLAATGLAWVCVGMVAGWGAGTGSELRCTFLAVGHGGCTVMETPDGKTLLYDAGAMGGPDVTRNQIAPFLWQRGIRRIDEVFLSHADRDHFNGLVSLLDRFAVGQVTRTPSFHEKSTPEVQHTLEILERRQIPVRTVRAGDELTAGDVELRVLHPPAKGPEGEENARSLVLLVRHGGNSILLTGDLEKTGLQMVLAKLLPQVDVLMAPHHGSRAGQEIELAARRKLVERTKPGVVVSCQGPPQWPARSLDPYRQVDVPFLGTWPHGAITIRSTRDLLVVETFKTREDFTLRAR